MIPLPHIDPPFYPKLVAWAKKQGVDPRAPALVMFAESGGINPQAMNPNGGASGINQFMPSTLKRYTSMPIASYRKLKASEQLDYALRYFSDQYNAHPAARREGAVALYWLNYLPAYYVPGASDSHVITSDPGIVKANPGLSSGGTSKVGDLKRFLANAVQSNATRWANIQANLVEAGANPRAFEEEPSSLLAKLPGFPASKTTYTVLGILGGSTVLGAGFLFLTRYFRRSRR